MNIDIWFGSAAILWLPGAATMRVLRPPRWGDGAVRLAIQLALGLAFWPLIFLWTSLLPVHWTPFGARCVVAACAVVIAFFRGRDVRFVRQITFWGSLIGLILTVTAWTRLRAIAGLVVPPWVDSVHHTMLVRLFLLKGTVPTNYDPFIPGARAFYHWGFHAIAAALSLFLGRTDPFSIPPVILSLGQWLNASTPLFVYAAAVSLTRSRTAAVIAAAISGLVSFYPAYYVSWGRFTHLGGVLLLLAWMALAARARRITAGSVAMLAIVAGGLALVHVRLAFFAVVFTIVMIAVDLLRRRRPVALLAAGALACVIVLPWLIAMRNVAPGALAPSDASPRWMTPAEVRANLLWVPHTAELLSAATAGLTGIAKLGPLATTGRVLSFVWWLAIIVIATRRKGRSRPLLWTYAVLIAWAALTLLILNATHLQFATNTSAAITAFVPLSIACGALIAWAIAPLRRAGTVVVVVICCAIGIATLGNIINPATIIATDADLAALRWMRDSTPASSAIVGRVQPWYGGAFIGVDGAYWSSVLADRRSLPPPSLYGWSGEFGEMELFLARWRDEYPFPTRVTRDEAKKLGVTHVYFGRGTPPEAPAQIGRVVYARDGITIAALE